MSHNHKPEFSSSHVFKKENKRKEEKERTRETKLIVNHILWNQRYSFQHASEVKKKKKAEILILCFLLRLHARGCVSLTALGPALGPAALRGFSGHRRPVAAARGSTARVPDRHGSISIRTTKVKRTATPMSLLKGRIAGSNPDLFIRLCILTTSQMILTHI